MNSEWKEIAQVLAGLLYNFDDYRLEDIEDCDDCDLAPASDPQLWWIHKEIAATLRQFEELDSTQKPQNNNNDKNCSDNS